MQRSLDDLFAAYMRYDDVFSYYDDEGFGFWCVSGSKENLKAVRTQTPMDAIRLYVHISKVIVKLGDKWIDDVEMHMQHDKFLSNGIPLRACIMHMRNLILDIIMNCPKTSDEVRAEIRKGKDPKEYKLSEIGKYLAFSEEEYDVLRGKIYECDYLKWKVVTMGGVRWDYHKGAAQTMLPLFPDVIMSMV